MNRKTLLLVTIFAEGGLFILGLLLIRFSQLDLGPRFQLSWSATLNGLLFCLPMLAMLFIAVRSPRRPLARLRAELDEKVMPIFANCHWPDLALIALFAGVGEELFFRGWLQSVLTSKFEVWSGILIASVIFGLVHYLSTTYALYAGLTGLYLGLIFQLSGNLFVVMFIHTLYDFIALLYLKRRGKEEKTNSYNDKNY